VAHALGITPLSTAQVWGAGSHRVGQVPFPGNTKGDFEDTVAKRKKAFDAVTAMGTPLAGHTPLWYYILREAEFFGVTKNVNEAGVCFGGQHLGPVGSRIVAETFIGMLFYDKNSFLHCQPAFKPHPKISGGKPLTLDGLITYALS
jgi:hypothetical protein